MIEARMNTFLQLCETMNYTKTAQLLSMTQPAVTQQIHHLEHFYDCKLFEYKGRTLQKTKKGELLEQMAKSMRYNSQVIAEKMRQKDSEISHIRLGATKTIGEYVIGDMIVRYLNDQNKNMTLTVDNTRVLLSMLDKGKIDIALIEGIFQRSHYAYKLFQKESFIGICAANHPFAGKTVEITDLFTQKIIAREKGSGTRDILTQLLHENGYNIDNFVRVTEINNFTLIKHLVEHGKGISFVYEVVAKKEIQDGKMAVFTVRGMELFHEFNFVYLQNSMIADEIIHSISTI